MAQFDRLKLKSNPFEPAASGAPLTGPLWVPPCWQEPLVQFLDTMEHAAGPKAYAILGEYGSGKTYLLRWLEREVLPERQILPFYFDNPGVQFYDLANTLLRRIGREEFAKSLYEYLRPSLSGLPRSLFGDSFFEWLQSVKRARRQDEAANIIAKRVREDGITEDEEIANKLGRIIVETIDRPYFEYKDFVAGRRGSYVAEREEAPYFAALIRALRLTQNVDAIALLIDEFEEISLQKRLTRRQAHDYLATLKRLINVAEEGNFWIIVTMTPPAAEITEKLEPALWERFTGQGKNQFNIPELDAQEAEELLRRRLASARSDEVSDEDLFPFTEDAVQHLRRDILFSPRRLIKTAAEAVARAAADSDIEVPFTVDYLQVVQETLYPLEEATENEEA